MDIMWNKFQELVHSENFNRVTRWNWATDAAAPLAELPNMEDREQSV